MNYEAKTIIGGSVAIYDTETGRPLDITSDFPGELISADVEVTMLRVYTTRGTYSFRITDEGKLVKCGGLNPD